MGVRNAKKGELLRKTGRGIVKPRVNLEWVKMGSYPPIKYLTTVSVHSSFIWTVANGILPGPGTTDLVRLLVGNFKLPVTRL